MKINYIAPVSQASGYGEFARQVIAGLLSIGVDIKIQPLQFDSKQLEFPELKALLGKHKTPDVNIINTPPHLFGQYRQSGTINIGYTMWEAEKLPEIFVEGCRKVDAVFVPSSHNARVFEECLNANPKVFLAKPPLNLSRFTGRVRANKELGKPYVFYSIFQWSDRKNPEGLIRAYWAAFTGRDDVVLRLKLYVQNQDATEVARINGKMGALRNSVRLRHYPKVEIITQHMSPQEIVDFHCEGNCFVSATRGEGLGMGQIEAMAIGNLVISPDHTGMFDFMRNYEDKNFPSSFTTNGCRVGSHQTPCINVNGLAPWYEGNNWWHEPDLSLISLYMQQATHSGYRENNENLANKGKINIQKLYNQEDCSKNIIKLIDQILNKGEK